jgi:hypothetical protein
MKKGANKVEWFSIKDKLPETGITSEYSSDWVLAFDGENIYMSKYIQLVTKQFWKEVYTDAPLSITHWMPLPSPPSSSNSD